MAQLTACVQDTQAGPSCPESSAEKCDTTVLRPKSCRTDAGGRRLFLAASSARAELRRYKPQPGGGTSSIWSKLRPLNAAPRPVSRARPTHKYVRPSYQRARCTRLVTMIPAPGTSSSANLDGGDRQRLHGRPSGGWNTTMKYFTESVASSDVFQGGLPPTGHHCLQPARGPAADRRLHGQPSRRSTRCLVVRDQAVATRGAPGRGCGVAD